MNKDDEPQRHVRTQSNSLLDDFIFKNERVLNIDHVDIDPDALERPMDHIRRIDKRLDTSEELIFMLREDIADLHARIDALSNKEKK